MRDSLGQLLLKQGVLTEEQLRSALAVQQTRSLPLGKILLEQGACEELPISKALAKQARMPFVNLAGKTPPERMTDRLDASAAWELEAIPVAEKGESTVVAVADPEKVVILDTLTFLLDGEVILALTTPTALREAMEKVYGQPNTEKDAGVEAFESTEESPVVRLVNRMFEEAVEARASDIHIEPFDNRVRIRIRVDGTLLLSAEHPKDLHPAILSHIKVNANLDIAEKRKPQDGRIEHRAGGRELDVRVSVVPTNHGESVVMRLLDREANLLSLSDLGMGEETLAWFQEVIDRPNGIFLVTGPTGSGKTTTLYAALQTLNQPSRKILTVEDPVEYRIKGINQVQVQPKIGLEFSKVLRAFLRQAPNIVLVGEIRDRETAEVAIQASLTGHLVFSTVHTNDAPSAITRLLDMGVPPFLVATSLQGVLAQRLLRRLCPNCSVTEEATALEKEVLQVEGDLKLGHPRGCSACNRTGFRGRVGGFESLSMNDAMREALFHSKDASEFHRIARNSGAWSPIADDVKQKVLSGQTTCSEMLRVTQVVNQSESASSETASLEPSTPENPE